MEKRSTEICSAVGDRKGQDRTNCGGVRRKRMTAGTTRGWKDRGESSEKKRLQRVDW